MVAEITLLAASLATVCIESFLYGIFFMLSVLSTYLLVSRHKSALTRRSIFFTPFFPSTLLMFATVTAHWIMTFIRLFDAFINFNSGGTPVLYYADLRRTTEVVKTAFLIATLFIGDSMIIYRLWIVWNYNLRIVIFPLCTLVGLIGKFFDSDIAQSIDKYNICGVGITFQFSIFPLGQDVFTSSAGKWITSDTVFTLCTNIYSSCLIAWRIWRINSSSRQFGGSNLNSLLAVIVESAAIYTSWTIFFITSYLSQSNIQFIGIDAFPAMAGISFMLITTRVGLGWAQNASIGASTDRTISALNARPPNSILSDSIPMHSLAVNISKSVNRNDEYHAGSASFNESFAKSEI